MALDPCENQRGEPVGVVADEDPDHGMSVRSRPPRLLRRRGVCGLLLEGGDRLVDESGDVHLRDAQAFPDVALDEIVLEAQA